MATADGDASAVSNRGVAREGAAPSDRMDGETLPPITPVPPDSYPPFQARPNRTDHEAVTRRLSQLGYIDDNEY